MRIDEIDLYGTLLISGSTGSEGQILTYNTSGGFDWGTASGGSSGPTSSYFKTSGYNYVICETVNNGVDPAADAIINGDNLANAYLAAKSLNVGVLSATNRVTVLLMPGTYDLGITGQFELDTSFIDIVGISTNPYNTILKSSIQYATLQYTAPVDSALKNVFLTNGSNLAVDDSEGSGNGSYLRWENIILNGNTFWNGVFYGFTNIYGEFKNIKVTDSTISFVCPGIIDGIFDNIEVGDGAYAFYNSGGGDIIGTFSNISVGDGAYAFYNSGGIYGNYQNITSGINTPVFVTSGTISGHFENIRVDNQPAFFVSSGSGDLIGTYKNISLGNSYNCFHSYGNIEGTFEDIEIGDATLTFYIAASGYINGTFSNITVGNISTSTFYNCTSISGSFKNIKFGDAGAAFVASTNLSGQFENISMGSVTNNALYASENIQGLFKNITIGNINDSNAFLASSGLLDGTFDEIQIGNIASGTGYFFTAGATVSGTFSNIEIGDASEWATGGISMFVSNSSGSITGSYKNIKVSNTSSLFRPEQGDLNGTFENIEFGSTSYALYTNTGSILGTYSNIKSLSQEGGQVFTSAIDLIGTFENIEISNFQNAFKSQNSLSGTFRNIKLGYLSSIYNNVFYSVTTDLNGTFENIEVGDSVILSGNNINSVFSSPTNIYGTYSNIKIGSGWASVFNVPGGGISGYFKDIYIPANGLSFTGASVSSTSIIDNLWCDNAFVAHLGGCKLLNSYINGMPTPYQSFNALYILSDKTIIENCKILGDATGPTTTILSSSGTNLYNVQILYTATNVGIYPPTMYQIGIAPLTPNYNTIVSS